MALIYGLRRSSNLADAANNEKCVQNLGLTIADFLTVAGAAATGVKASDFLALKGLRSTLEAQITGLAGQTATVASGVALKALSTGDTISGIITVNGIVSSDRAFIRTIGGPAIYSAASGSFFSPISGSSFSGGASYRSGPTRISGLTLPSGAGNYTGFTFPFQSHYENYKIYQRIGNNADAPYAIRTKLPPPTVFSGCGLWLDAEKSTTTIVGANRVSQWQSVIDGGYNAVQTVSGSSPFFLVSGIVDSGVVKPALAFSGSSEFMNLGPVANVFASGATLVIMAQIENGDYCLVSNSTSNQGRWRTTSGNGSWPLFCSSLIPRFPAAMPANGTVVFSIRASQAFGLEVRSNGNQIGYIAPSGFVYQGSGQYLLGTAASAGGRFAGKIMGLIGYSQPLANRELRTVEEYMMWRYNSVYDPDKAQVMQLEDGATLELENNLPVELG